MIPEDFYKNILARSNGESLTNHINSIVDLTNSIIQENSAFKEYSDVEKNIILLIITFHDIGKCANVFQEILSGESDKRWNYRHELISLILLINNWKNIEDYINEALHEDKNIFNTLYLSLITLLTHHKSLSYFKDYKLKEEESFNRFRRKFDELFCNKDYINKLFYIIEDQYKNILNNQIEFKIASKDIVEELNDYMNQNEEIIIDYYKLIISKWKRYIDSDDGYDLSWDYNNFSENPKIDIFLKAILLRGLFITSDHLSAAGITKLKNITNRNVINIIFQEKNYKLNHYQLQIEKILGDALLFAPTASGKTEAALIWALKNLDSDQDRIFFLLPYTASCNKMYERLSSYFGEDNVGIIHHTSQFFLYSKLLESEEDLASGSDQIKYKIQMMKKNYLPVKIITPFQLLKIFFGQPAFETFLLELFNAKIVFDEIHVYEPRTMAQIIVLIKFLKSLFNTKFLIMTATMPEFLKQEFYDAFNFPYSCKYINQYIPNDEYIEDENPNQKLNEISYLLNRRRHKFKIIDEKIIDSIDLDKKVLSAYLIEIILNSLRKDLRILIVVNNIQTSKDIFNEIIKNQDIAEFCKKNDIGLIHGELILKDRIFSENNIENYKILISTQVVEVSLDIDFNLGIFEICPLDALIQRAGRINRTGKRSDPESIFVFAKNAGKKSPYQSSIIEKSLNILNKTYNLNTIFNINSLTKIDENFLKSTLINNDNFRIISDYEYSEMVQELYKDGYSLEDNKIFINEKKNFSEFIKKYLRPFEYDKDLFKQFEKMFDSIEVIPKKFKETCLELINSNQFYEIPYYTVSISKKKFYFFKKSGILLKEKERFFVDKKYIDRFGFI